MHGPGRVRYRPAELAERLGTSRNTVYKLWNAEKMGQRKKPGQVEMERIPTCPGGRLSPPP